MKKLLLIGTGIIIAASATLFAAEQMDGMTHGAMHEMMMKRGGLKEDARIELRMPEPMKVLHKSVMRSHLDSIGNITEALASDDLKKAAAIARTDLGWNPEEEKMCSAFGGGDKEFFALGKAMHMQADRLADDASKGHKDAALADTAGLIKSCNACHEKFRH